METKLKSLKIAVIGQSKFGADVYQLLRKQGHEIVGVFTIPDKDGRPDLLAVAAEADGVKVIKNKSWRLKGAVRPEVLEEYTSVGAELNVMPFCSQFIPLEVINHPKYKSICYHPSILPRHRGASAISWTLIQGDKKAGFTIFWPDDGLDTGPILLIRECEVDPDDTLNTIYKRFLYPEGVKAMGLAVRMIAEGTAPKLVQTTEGATYDAMLKKDIVRLSFDQSAQDIHNYIRGCDHVPGAWTEIDGKRVTFHGSKLRRIGKPEGEPVTIEGASHPAIVHTQGMTLFGNDGKMVDVERLSVGGKMIPASKYGADMDGGSGGLELSDEEKAMQVKARLIWQSILNMETVDDSTDFFSCGAGSMDVVRLVEELKEKCGLSLTNDKVYMNTTFKAFTEAMVLNYRGEDAEQQFSYTPVELNANNMDLKFPNQIFINNEFIDASDGGTFTTINPADETVICSVAKATPDDVDYAVHCAKNAFEDWKDMNARDRGTLMFKLADLMEEHQEELATLESLDSGAVYTLALKTHIGMSIQTIRYFAGWCDKIHGQTIPINHAKPNHNLTFTKKEPIGVCGIITPWNYPLMMLAWKISPCLAAGNVVVLKPAQVTPLTSLKFAELAARAGFPPGVINILPGSGRVCGQAMIDHPDVRKIGFTGSTPVGKQIMASCATSNLKKCSLELGGKSPLIIFADCDMTKAVRMALSGVFFNKGENCIAAGRLFVEDSIHDEFVEKVIAEVKKMKIGNPLDRSVDHGPQNHLAHFNSLIEYVKTGVKEGARLIYGGKKVEGPGLFFEPTIMTHVDDHMWVAKEESFGPIMIISSFDDGDIDGVIKSANATEFGLASGVMTNDLSKALEVSSRLEAGTCFVNTYNKTDVAAPFGGFKQSGFGKDLGQEALNEYLKTKVITVEY